MGQHKPTALIKRPNCLANKVDKLEGITAQALIERTEKIVDEKAGGFADWINDDLHALKALSGKLVEGKDPQTAHIIDIFRKSADIRDQGTVCGYPSMTRIAGLLCDFIEHSKDLNKTEIELVDTHIDILLAVLAARIKTEDSDFAQRHITNLQAASAKLRGG